MVMVDAVLGRRYTRSTQLTRREGPAGVRMYLFGQQQQPMGCVPRTHNAKLQRLEIATLVYRQKTEQRITCAGKEEEKHEQETVNAHGEDSSENGLTVRILKGTDTVAVVFDEWRYRIRPN